MDKLRLGMDDVMGWSPFEDGWADLIARHRIPHPPAVDPCGPDDSDWTDPPD